MEKCNTLVRRGLLPTILSRKESVNDERHENRSKQEDDSIWLFNVLNIIGVNDDFRMKSQRAGSIREILQSFAHPTTSYHMGSTFEGTFTPDEPTDFDFLKCDELIPVIEDLSLAQRNSVSLLVVRELDTPAGYVKLQLAATGLSFTDVYWPLICWLKMDHCLKVDRSGRLVLFDFLVPDKTPILQRQNNKPALKAENYYNMNTDTVFSYRCTTWPTMAEEWLFRQRHHGWPSTDMIQELKSLGFFVVRKGHPFSCEIDVEWRISLSLQERKLIMNLTDVQHKCFVVLKMLNRDTIMLNCLTSYHWKTCLFYVIEENNQNIWEKKDLFHCIQLCVAQMLKWIKCGFCPNYFIPKENLFDGRLNNSLRLVSEKILEELLNVGFHCFLHVKGNNICDYVRSRGSVEWFKMLQANSEKVYDQVLYIINTSIIRTALTVFKNIILSRYGYRCNKKSANFITLMWTTLGRIENSEPITEHTYHETKYALSLLLPHIYTCLASSISAMAIEIPNPKIRDFLLLGSFTYFMRDKLSGRLKFLSVLYAAGLYKDCEWWVNHMNEEYIAYIPSFCSCRFIKDDTIVILFNGTRTPLMEVSTCVLFMPNELPITPDALKYEMFRFVGIPSKKEERTNKVCQWHYRAVVDSNILYFLLKYLIKRKVGRIKESEDAVNCILNLMLEKNVRHRDVAYNVIGWILHSKFHTPQALFYLEKSWQIMNSWDLGCFIFTEEMKRKQYLFNSAKIHAVVILYNTWVASKTSKIHFCFQCLNFDRNYLRKCSRCKTAAYCSRLCQKMNWKIHKTVCKIARTFHKPV